MKISCLFKHSVFLFECLKSSLFLQIQVDLEGEGHYDVSNQLVLPSKKRKTIIKNESKHVTRILSKKQRKHLEKIVERKKKKENVSTIWYLHFLF